MTRSRTTCCALSLVLFWLGLAAPLHASSLEFKVIVHPDNPVTAIDRSFLRDAFLKTAVTWPHGPAIRPIDLPASVPARESFTREVLKKTPAQLRSYWSQHIFSGTGVPPPEADSTAAVIAYVLANPGAVAYLPVHVDPDGAKVIALR